MNKLSIFLIITVLALVVDFIWITKIMKGFYLSGMGLHAKLDAEGNLQPVLWSALAVYIIIPLAVLVFALDGAQAKPLIEIILKGAFLGFCMYGVYDFTNYATLKDWPLKMTLVDVMWGSFLCALLSGVGGYLSKIPTSG
jgi:uncharacterized membrane protein